MLSDDEALELARRLPAVLKFFPARNPQVLAEVGLVFSDLVATPEAGEMVYQALLTRGGDWSNVATFRRLVAELTSADPRLESRRPVAPAAVICADCPFNCGDPDLKPEHRAVAIDWAERNCPGCPLLATAYLLRADDLAHFQASA